MTALKLYVTTQNKMTKYLDIKHFETIPPKNSTIKLDGKTYIIKHIVTDEHNIAIIEESKHRNAFWHED